MHKLNNYLTIIFLFLSLMSLSQNKETTVYVIFNHETEEKCKVDLEGKGITELPKFRIEEIGNYIDFKICNEQFRFDKKMVADTLSSASLKKLNIFDLNYLINKKNGSPMKVNPFKKVFILKKDSYRTILKYPVIWIDGMVIQN